MPAIVGGAGLRARAANGPRTSTVVAEPYSDAVTNDRGVLQRRTLGTLVTNSASGEVGILLGTGESVAF